MPNVTDRSIQALKGRQQPHEVGYGDGFYVRVYPDGRKVARYRYRLAGKTRILTLGEYGRRLGQFTLAELLQAHTAARGKVAGSTDPALERDQGRQAVALARAEHEARVTLKTICEDFKRRYKGSKTRNLADSTRREYERRIDQTIIPKWGAFPVDDLPADKMIGHMESLPPVEANRMFATVNVILNWARKNRQDVTHNPFAGRDKPGGHETPKNRALDYDPETEVVRDIGEIKAFWVGTETLDPALRDALRLVLLSGQRPSEVLSIKVDHLVNGCWRIPAATTKNKKRVHVVPITPMMKTILDRRAKNGQDLLFPDASGKKPIRHARLSRALKMMLTTQANPTHGLEHFTPHDLRRTCATHLGALGYTNAEIGLVLNHTTPGVTSIYNQADAARRVKPMLETWARRVKAVLGGKSAKVVSLHQ